MRSAASGLKVMRVGNGKPSPKPTTSRVPSEGTKATQIGRRVGHRRAQQRLVAVVGHAHREQRAALGDDGGIELGGPLRDEAEAHAVFAPLLGDAQQRAAGRREADRAIGGA